MALLHSLQLQGIRSFGHESSNAQVIEFFTPVTLFLGQNGSGKTTIIEALKYACSGELPPNSDNGKCFVHDPKINMLPEVKGHIKLRFIDARGRQITVMKIVQVTNKDSKSQFSSLSHAIKIRELDGTETELSQRCVDLKTIIFQYFGVSKAIINNVIFCQQDNALWPLEDGKKLKEKFDDIFNIGLYNKAIDNMRLTVKTKNDDLKRLRDNLKYASELKEEVGRKQSNLCDKKKQKDTLKSEMAEKTEVLNTIRGKIMEVAKLENELSNLMKQLASKEAEKESIKKQQDTLSESIRDIYNGSDEELKAEIESFKSRSDQDKIELQKYKDNLDELEVNENRLNDALKKLQVKLGTLKEKQEQHASKVSLRNSLIKKLAEDIGVESHEYDDSLIITLDTQVQKSQHDLNEMRRKQKVEEQAVQDEIMALKEKVAGTNQNIKLKQQDIKETHNKFCEISSKLHDLNVSDEQMNSYTQKISKLTKELEGLNASFDLTATTNKIKSNREKIADLERNQEDLEKDRKLLQKNLITESEIDSKNLLARKREAEISKLKDRHRQPLNALFKEVPKNNFKQTLQARILDIETVLSTSRKNFSEQQKTVTRLEFEKNSMEDRYKGLKEKLDKCRQNIEKACRGKSYDECLTELRVEIDRLLVEKGEYKSLEIMYKKYIKHLQERKCCPVCDTGFHERVGVVDKLVESMSTKIKRLPEEIRMVEEQLQEKQDRHAQLLALRTVNDEIADMETRLPIAKQEIVDVEGRLMSARETLNELEESLSTNSADLKMCNDVLGDSTVIDQYQDEVKTIRGEINDLKSDLITLPSNMSLTEIDEKLEDVKEELTSTRKSCETLQKKINQNNDRRHELTQERNVIVEKQLNLQKNVQGRPVLEEQRADLQKREETLNETVSKLNEEKNTLMRSLAETKDKLENLKESNETAFRKCDDVHKRRKSMYGDVVKLQSEIKCYADEKTDDLLAKTKTNMCNFLLQIQNIKTSRTEKANQMNELTRSIDGRSEKFRALNDNRRLRELCADEKRVDAAIVELRGRLANYNHATIQEEKLTLGKRFSTIETEVIYKEGQLQEIETSINELEQDLARSVNQNAYKNFKRKLFEVNVTTKVIADIGEFNKSLENAIIKYHATRMRHVNAIIKDLWQSIYKGNDIDYVEIKASESTANRARRVYNYNVVQRRNNVELDMSGRCSAGQKVLACLLIRMALAETFSHNCGILALDEPTTNLDRDNIKSLADALMNIINTRQQQKNFQLLIITHDTYFLNILKTVGCAEYYYKVSRDLDGTSLVTQQSL